MTTTENYILIPETSYLRDPCLVYRTEPPYMPSYLKDYIYDSNVNGRILVINKTDFTLVATAEADSDFFITHLFGAYEADNNTLILDALKYDSPEPYTKYTFVEEAIYGDDYATNQVYRFTIDLAAETAIGEEWIAQPPGTFLEFSNINRAYTGIKYRY
jgi:carotenoid cleavage dioxygenase-like enzyme